MRCSLGEQGLHRQSAEQSSATSTRNVTSTSGSGLLGHHMAYGCTQAACHGFEQTSPNRRLLAAARSAQRREGHCVLRAAVQRDDAIARTDLPLHPQSPRWT